MKHVKKHGRKFLTSLHRKKELISRLLYQSLQWERWIQPTSEELTDLYSTNIIRLIESWRMRRAGHAPHMGERRGAYRVLEGKPEGSSLLGRSRRRWKDNSKMYLREVGWRCMDWINLAQDRDSWRALEKVVMDHRVSRSAGNFLPSWEPVGFSRRTLCSK